LKPTSNAEEINTCLAIGINSPDNIKWIPITAKLCAPQYTISSDIATILQNGKAMMPDIQPKQTSTLALTLRNIGAVLFQYNIELDDASFILDNPSKTVGVGGSTTLMLKFIGSKNGRHTCNCTLRITGLGTSHKFSISVVVGEPKPTFLPAKIRFPFDFSSLEAFSKHKDSVTQKLVMPRILLTVQKKVV